MSTPNPLAYTLPYKLTKTIHRDPYDAIAPEKAENSQNGKIILITGGGSGIGAAAAAVWVRAGADGVVIAGRRADRLEQTAASLRASSKKTKVLAVKTDITDEKAVVNLFTQIQDTFGRPADVVLANAGFVSDIVKVGEDPVDNWWNVWEINVKGFYTTVHHFIKSQPNPKEPVGTIISISTGLAGSVFPGVSSYTVSKLAAERLIEHIDAEYPTLRAFSLMPGVVNTELINPAFIPFAKDHVELAGMTSLWLAQPKADFIKGQIVHVNWDVEELEAYKDKIKNDQPLKIKWLPILPSSGGHGFE